MKKKGPKKNFISQSKTNPLHIVFGLLLISVLSFIGFYLGGHFVNPAPVIHKDYFPTPTSMVATEEELSSWTTYSDPKLGFTLKYPANEVIITKQFTEGGLILNKKEDILPNDPYGKSQLMILLRSGKIPAEALEVDTCSTCKSLFVPAKINNAVGIRTTAGFDSDNNYYLNDEKGIGPFIRVDASAYYPETNIDIYKKIIQTFRFDR